LVSQQLWHLEFILLKRNMKRNHRPTVENFASKKGHSD
jgi:hypothetical protein